MFKFLSAVIATIIFVLCAYSFLYLLLNNWLVRPLSKRLQKLYFFVLKKSKKRLKSYLWRFKFYQDIQDYIRKIRPKIGSYILSLPNKWECFKKQIKSLWKNIGSWVTTQVLSFDKWFWRKWDRLKEKHGEKVKFAWAGIWGLAFLLTGLETCDINSEPHIKFFRDITHEKVEEISKFCSKDVFEGYRFDNLSSKFENAVWRSERNNSKNEHLLFLILQTWSALAEKKLPDVEKYAFECEKILKLNRVIERPLLLKLKLNLAIGESYFHQEKFQKADSLLSFCYEYSQEFFSPFDKFYALKNYGILLNRMGQFDSSIVILKEAVAIIQNNNIGEIEMTEIRVELAKNYSEIDKKLMELSLFQKITNSSENFLQIYGLSKIANFYYKNNSLDDVLCYNELANNLMNTHYIDLKEVNDSINFTHLEKLVFANLLISQYNQLLEKEDSINCIIDSLRSNDKFLGFIDMVSNEVLTATNTEKLNSINLFELSTIKGEDFFDWLKLVSENQKGFADWRKVLYSHYKKRKELLDLSEDSGINLLAFFSTLFFVFWILYEIRKFFLKKGEKRRQAAINKYKVEGIKIAKQNLKKKAAKEQEKKDKQLKEEKLKAEREKQVLKEKMEKEAAQNKAEEAKLKKREKELLAQLANKDEEITRRAYIQNVTDLIENQRKKQIELNVAYNLQDREYEKRKFDLGDLVAIETTEKKNISKVYFNKWYFGRRRDFYVHQSLNELLKSINETYEIDFIVRVMNRLVISVLHIERLSKNKFKINHKEFENEEYEVSRKPEYRKLYKEKADKYDVLKDGNK